MQLTAAQKTALKAHATANTNSTPATAADGTALVTPFVVNTRLQGNPDDQRAIAEWYNQNAKSGDNQAFANRNIWNPQVTVGQLNSTIVWATVPVGATPADLTNSWLLWQSMCWAGTQLSAPCLDLSDPQVRKGVTKVWGDVGAGNAAAIGGSGCGQRVGSNLELVCSNAAAGASGGGALTDAHPVQKDSLGSLLYGQKIDQPTMGDVLLNG